MLRLVLLSFILTAQMTPKVKSLVRLVLTLLLTILLEYTAKSLVSLMRTAVATTSLIGPARSVLSSHSDLVCDIIIRESLNGSLFSWELI